MADEVKQDAASSEDQPQEQPQGEGQPAPEPDYKAKWEQSEAKATALEAERAKYEQQYRSLQGSTKKRFDLEASIEDLNRRIERQGEVTQAALEGLLQGDVETASQKVATVRERHQADEGKDSQAKEVKALWGKMGRDIRVGFKAEEGKEGAIWQSAPELEEARQLAQQAEATGSITLLREAAELVREARFNAQLKVQVEEAVRMAKKNTEDEIRGKVKDEKESAGAFDMPRVPAGGPGIASLEALLNQDVPDSPAERDKYERNLLAAAKRAAKG